MEKTMPEVGDGATRDCASTEYGAEETTNSLHGCQFAAKLALKGALLLAPLAGSAIAIEYAPPTHLEVAGVHVELQVKLGEDVTSASILGGAASIKLPSRSMLGPRSVGLDATLDVTKVSLVNQRGALDPKKITDFASMFNDYTPIEQQLIGAARSQVAISGAVGLELVAGVELAAIGVQRRRRRRLDDYGPSERAVISQYQQRSQRQFVVGAAVLGVGLFSLGGQAAFGSNHHQSLTPNELLAGTGLSGAELNGPLRPVMEAAIPPALNFIEKTNKFYNHAEDQLRSAFAMRYNENAPPKETDVMRIIVAEDFQGKTGMERLVGVSARLWHVDKIVVSGDIAFSGSSYETPTISNLSYYAGKHIQILASMGIHDSSATRELARKDHWLVDNGAVQRTSGASFQLVDDPRHVELGGQVYSLTDQTVSEYTQAAIGETCTEHPDFVVVHDHEIGSRIAQSGCAKVVLDGRSYDPLPLQRYDVPGVGSSVELTSGSAGAYKTNDGFNLGAIDNNAAFRVLDYNLTTHSVKFQDIAITNTGAAILHEPITISNSTLASAKVSDLPLRHQALVRRRK